MEEQLLNLLAIHENLGIMIELIKNNKFTPQMWDLYQKMRVSWPQPLIKYEVPVIQEIKAQNINKLITKYIDKDYACASFGNIEVIMMISNGYINVTKLCALGGSLFKDWKRTQNAQRLIQVVENELNFHGEKTPNQKSAIISIKQGGNQQITGSYAHPDIVVHIASWLSPEFAIMVSRIVNNYIIEKFEHQKQMELKIKDDKINDLDLKLDFVIKQNEEQKQRIDFLISKNEEISQQNEELLQNTKTINNKLDFVKKDYVVQTGQEKDESYLVIYNNFKKNPAARTDKDFDYTALRVMKKSYMTRVTSHLQKYQYAVDILTVENPYANNLWQRIKQNLKDRGFIDCTYISFNLLENYTERQLLADIRNMNDIRFRI